MTELAIKVFWLFLPAGLANMAPILVRKHIPFLGFPIYEKLFGKNKTWRGLLSGTVVAIIAVYIQRLVYPMTQNIALLDYEHINIIVLGIILGAGALIGDIIESFIKRQLKIAPGESLPVLDQTDWIVGVLILSGFFYQWPLNVWITAIILFGLLHAVTSLTGYALGIRKHKF